MARRGPDARARLERSALTLFARQGFERTTAAEIAAAAGVTERTFFRYFTDKREVLFPDAAPLQEGLAEAVAAHLADGHPGTEPDEDRLDGNHLDGPTAMTLVRVMSRSFAEVIEARGDLARQRDAVISASPDLRERELAKMAAVATAMSRVLAARGVTEPAASVAPEAAVAAIRVAFRRWIDDPERRPLTTHLDECLDTLVRLTAGPGQPY